MGKIVRNGIEFSSTSDTADNINYNNSKSGLEAMTAQEAIDEINENVSTLTESLVYSTKEKVVGTWYNGKTLYRKVFTFNGEGSYALDLPQNVSEMFTLNDCVLFRSVAIGSDTALLRTNPYFLSTDDYWNTFIDFTAKHLTIRQVGQTGTTVYVIPVYYTLND